MTLRGIDISHWQTYTPSLAGLSFVFCRATYGIRPDDRYAHHAANVREAGLVLGAYHFGRHGNVPAQVLSFLSVGGTADLLALDLENDAGNPDMTQDEAREFIRLVQSTGRAIGLYHSESGFPSLGQDWNWVAKWSTTQPSIPWDIWQYRGSPLDLDAFNGTLAQLRALGRETPLGLRLIFDPTRTGTVDIAAGVRAIRLTDRADYVLPQKADNRPAVGARLIGGSGGYVVTLDGEAHFVYNALATFTPTPPPDPEPATYTVTVGGKTAGNVTLP